MAAWRLRHALHAIALVVGAIALAVLVDRLGWSGIRGALGQTGVWFAAIAAIDLASVCCDAAGVRFFLLPHAPIAYWRVLAAQASGLAINRLTPGNSLGEPIKVALLVAHVPEAAAISAIVMFNLATILVAVTAITIGVPITLLSLDLPGRLELAVWIATAVLVALALALVALLRRGALVTLIATAVRLRLLSAARATRWRDRVAAIDAAMRTFGDPALRRGFLYCVASRLLNWAGTLVILHTAAVPLDPSFVIGVLTVGILITWVSSIIPLGLGVADGSNYALYALLGASPQAGLDFTLINRTRTCVLAALGLAVLALSRTDTSGTRRARDGAR